MPKERASAIPKRGDSDRKEDPASPIRSGTGSKEIPAQDLRDTEEEMPMENLLEHVGPEPFPEFIPVVRMSLLVGKYTLLLWFHFFSSTLKRQVLSPLVINLLNPFALNFGFNVSIIPVIDAASMISQSSGAFDQGFTTGHVKTSFSNAVGVFSM
jgi:hypothetical protein